MNKFVIVVLGTDGSGKSTIINNITPILKSKYNNVYYEHMRPNYINSLGVTLRKRTIEEEKQQGPTTDPHSKKPSGFIGSLLRLSYYMIDYTWGYFRKIYPTKNCIWIFDRYYYDYFIDQRRGRLNLPLCVIKFYSYLVPKPNIIFCLGGDPEMIYKRKPETSLEEVKRQTKILKEFCDKNKNAIWIDTCTDLNSSVTQVLDSINNIMK